MQSAERTLASIVTRNFVALGVGELAARVVSFLTVIYIARTLGAEAYGIVGFAAAVVLYFAGVADFGIEALGPREMAHDPKRVGPLAASVIAIRLLFSGVLALGIGLFGLLVLPNPDGHVLALQSLTLIAVGVSTRWVFLGMEKAGRVSVARVVGEVLRVLLVLLVVHSAADLLLVPLTQAIAELSTGLILLYLLWRHGAMGKIRMRLAEAWAILRSAFPLVVTTLLGLVIYNSDLLLLRTFQGPESVGLYLAAYTLIALLGNLGTAYGASLLPTLTRAEGLEGGQVGLYRASISHVVAVAIPIGAGGYLLAPQIIGLAFGPSYESSAPVLAVLILSIPFLLVRMILQTVLVSAGQQERVMRITGWAAAFNVLLNLVLIPRFGMMGAAFTTVLTEVVRLVVIQVYVRMQGFPLTGGGRVVHTLISTALMVGVLILASVETLWVAVPLGAVVYGIAMFFPSLRFPRSRKSDA